LGSAAASITFSSIPATYTDLRLVLVFTGTSATAVRCRVNGDTATNYSRTYIYGDGTTAGTSTSANTAYFNLTAQINQSTTIPEMLVADLFSYAGSTYKTMLVNHAGDQNGSGGTENIVGLWRSTSAVTSMLIYPAAGNFNTGTTATLYGIKAA
jgi:hypothetical protein